MIKSIRRGLVALLFVVVTMSAPLAPAQPPSEPRGPNVLIIVTDDQRHAGTLKVMERTRAWFKRGGTLFNHAFATTPLCCPSRASIMTGSYVHNHGVRAHTAEEVRNLDHRSTLQAYLQQAGYRTGIFGKYLNKWPIRQDPPFFDTWAVYSKGNPYYKGTYNVHGKVRTVHRYWARYMRKKVREFLANAENDDPQPWFLYLSPPAPHGPAVAERKHRNAKVGKWHGNRAVFEGDRTDKPPYVLLHNKDLEDGRRVRTKQLRALLSVDDVVGYVADQLEKRSESDTLAFFVSDNGEMWAEHGILGKTFPYSYSVHVPLMVRWQEDFVAGGRDGRLAANIDIAPTVLDAANVEPRRPMDGRSLLEPWERDRLLLEYWRTPDFTTPSWAALRRHNEVYVEYYEQGGAVSFREYYNLAKDPWELKNLLGDINPLNDPNTAMLSDQLRRDRACAPGSCP